MNHTDITQEQKHSFIRKDVIILSIILIIAFLFRLYRVDTPLADFHSFRQVDTAAVARNFARDGFDLLHPRYDDFSNVASGKENPNGYRFVEFPIYNAIFAFFYKYIGILTIETYGRLTSSVFSLFIIAIIYYLGLKEGNRTTAIVASVTYAVMPPFVFFSRMVLPETPSLAMAFIAIFCMYRFAMDERNAKTYMWYILGTIAFAIALLIKPTSGFYALVIGWLFLRKYRLRMVLRWEPYVFVFLSLLPFIWWRQYIQQFPEGIPVNTWLLTSTQTFEGEKVILMRPAFFRWIFYERLGTLILGVYLSFFFLLGIIVKTKKYLFHVLLASAFIYLFVFQGGNVQHAYYQTIILPAIALFIGVGTAWVVKHSNYLIHPIITYPLIAAVFIFSWLNSYYQVKIFYDYATDLHRASKVLTSFIKPTDKIVTDRLGDTTLLYLLDRKGAATIFKDPQSLKNDGYKYLVTDRKETLEKYKADKYTFIFESSQFSIIKL